MDKKIEAYLRAISAFLLVLTVAVIVMGVIALRKVERMVRVSEHMAARVDRALDAAAPVGQAVVDKGAEAIHQMDAKELGQQATKGAKEIGDAAKQKAMQWIKSQSGDGNGAGDK